MPELTVRYDDPAPALERVGALSGLQYLRAVASGELPWAPIGHLMGMRPDRIEEGEVEFVAEPGPQHLNPIGLVHGGLAATLLDSVTGCAVHTVLPAGVGYATTDLHVRYLRPVPLRTGEVRAVGRVVHAGRRVAVAHGELFDQQDRLLATADASCLLTDG